MKHIPNLISISRIFLSLLLLFLLKNTIVFIIIYLLCGVSDILDGLIARKTNTKSKLGAKLDSVADLVLFGIIIVCMLQLIGKDLREFYPLLIAITLIRFINLLIAFYKYHTFLILHTWGNKATGIGIYISTVILILSGNRATLYPVLILAMLSAIEEGILHIISKQPDPDRRGLFLK